METAIVLIILALIATLVMPDLLSKEILIALVAGAQKDYLGWKAFYAGII